MKYRIISDTHLGHTSQMIEYCGRPENYEDRIIKSIKTVVGNDDILIHLGDVCIGNDDKWNRAITDACAGKCWLVRGNHDKRSNRFYLVRGWDWVGDSMTLNIFGRSILFTHIPSQDVVDVNVHGHLHNSGHRGYWDDDKHILVMCEHSYEPVDLRRLVE